MSAVVYILELRIYYYDTWRTNKEKIPTIKCKRKWNLDFHQRRVSEEINAGICLCERKKRRRRILNTRESHIKDTHVGYIEFKRREQKQFCLLYINIDACEKFKRVQNVRTHSIWKFHPSSEYVAPFLLPPVKIRKKEKKRAFFFELSPYDGLVRPIQHAMDRMHSAHTLHICVCTYTTVNLFPESIYVRLVVFLVGGI
jgi:hypothetical protein